LMPSKSDTLFIFIVNVALRGAMRKMLATTILHNYLSWL
jgi:hypothetical protein